MALGCTTSGRAAACSRAQTGSLVHRSGVCAATAGSRRPRATRSSAAVREAEKEVPYVLSNGIIDYYEVLGVADMATPCDIKAAYRAMAKVCHPDSAGEDGHDMCVLLNEAYVVLSDPAMRSLYNAQLDAALEDEGDGYTGQPVSKWMAGTKMGKNADPEEKRGVFVDEVACIGCKQCVWVAPATFRIEPEHGRSRVFGQWLDTEANLEAAIQSCPVECIHWVDRDDLAPLEFAMQRVGRPSVGIMQAGQAPVPDVWAAAAQFVKERQRREEQRRRAAAYSPAQEAARRDAAQRLVREQMGWVSDWADRLGISAAIMGTMQSIDTDDDGAYSDGEYSAYKKVGRRRRMRPQGAGPGARNAGGGRVPDERALVPVEAAAQRQVWHR